MDKRHHLLALLLSRVTEGPDCHAHSGSKGSHGYPQATGPQGYSGPAHRMRWLLEVGEIPAGLMVLHNCNNKQCVRLDHLRLGSHIENMDDVSRAGHPRRKLSNEDAVFVRLSGLPIRQLARRFGVSQRLIQGVVRGLTYRHAGEEVPRMGTG